MKHIILTVLILLLITSKIFCQNFYDLNLTEEQFDKNLKAGTKYTHTTIKDGSRMIMWEDESSLDYLYFDTKTHLSYIHVVMMKSIYSLNPMLSFFNNMGIKITEKSWVLKVGTLSYSIELKNDDKYNYKWFFIIRPL